eukprot:1196138-Prorocentrum_minimum.AAC.7
MRSELGKSGVTSSLDSHSAKMIINGLVTTAHLKLRRIRTTTRRLPSTFLTNFVNLTRNVSFAQLPTSWSAIHHTTMY